MNHKNWNQHKQEMRQENRREWLVVIAVSFAIATLVVVLAQ
jgi:hypothetical protein